ncbi:MAG: hypothetical protein RR478_00735 [Bacilli bacterium]
MNKKKFMMILLLAIMVSVLLLIVIIDNKKADKDKIDKDNNNGSEVEKPNNDLGNPELVKNHDRFFTIEKCISKYYTYLNNSEPEKVLLLLNPEYVKKNNVTINTINNTLSDNKENFMYNSKKMYKQKLANNITRYFVYGNVTKSIIDEQPIYIDNYMIVYLDENLISFSVEPYLGKFTDTNVTTNLNEIIKQANKVYNKDNIYVKENAINSYNVNHLSDQNICDMYYYNMKNLFIYNFEDAKKKITNVDSDEKLESYFKGNIKKYSFYGKDGNLNCKIIDSNNLQYSFYITNILEYNVSLDTYKENN